MAKEPPKRRGSAAPAARTHVMASVKLDVATHARVSAAAALAGLDKSAWMSRVIGEAVSGLVLIDRRPGGRGKPADQGDPSGELGSAGPG